MKEGEKCQVNMGYVKIVVQLGILMRFNQLFLIFT